MERRARYLLAVHCAVATADWHNDDTLYTRAIEANPESAMGYGWMGLSLVKRDRPADAIPYLEQAVLRDPETHRYLARLGQSLHEVGRLQDAAMIAARGIETFGDRPEEASYRMLALRSMTTPSPDLAAEHLTRCLQVWPDRRDCRDAIERLRRDPAHAAAFRRVGLTLKRVVRITATLLRSVGVSAATAFVCATAQREIVTA